MIAHPIPLIVIERTPDAFREIVTLMQRRHIRAFVVKKIRADIIAIYSRINCNIYIYVYICEDICFTALSGRASSYPSRKLIKKLIRDHRELSSPGNVSPKRQYQFFSVIL